jgi:hypothetical protein
MLRSIYSSVKLRTLSFLNPRSTISAPSFANSDPRFSERLAVGPHGRFTVLDSWILNFAALSTQLRQSQSHTTTD